MVLELPLEASPASAKLTRLALAELPLPAETRDTAGLLATEMVTNAVRHADLPPDATIRVSVEVREEALRIAVCDPGRRFPGIRMAGGPAEPTTPGGLGLVLIERMSSRWGLERGAGTRVWCELDASTSHAA